MLRCGLRVSEACALTWEAVDLQAGTVRIKHGKGEIARLVYVSADGARAFQRWRRHHTSGPYMFPSPQRRREETWPRHPLLQCGNNRILSCKDQL